MLLLCSLGRGRRGARCLQAADALHRPQVGLQPARPEVHVGRCWWDALASWCNEGVKNSVWMARRGGFSHAMLHVHLLSCGRLCTSRLSRSSAPTRRAHRWRTSPSCKPPHERPPKPSCPRAEFSSLLKRVVYRNRFARASRAVLSASRSARVPRGALNAQVASASARSLKQAAPSSPDGRLRY